jgi:HAD superfamily hydrolase (TIGR01662 family)
MISLNFQIDKSWSLFLDRDGVINQRIIGGYVTTWEKIEFIPGVPDAIAMLSELFGRIVVVSNQQGVGKGLMSDKDVRLIHEGMASAILKAGGRIDAFYYAPQMAASHSLMRKPGVGMGLKARRQFPEISFRRSVMVGDSFSDMVFGKRLGMLCVLVADNPSIARNHHKVVDLMFPSLPAFASCLKQQC